MAPIPLASSSPSGLDRVRARLLTALHVGRLRPGDRVPSVRRLADLTGMNRKTVHRAYSALAREGLLQVRPGSGTFVAERETKVAETPAATDLVASANRCRAEAAALGLSPATFARFVAAYLADGLLGLPVTVTECNREQLEIMAGDLVSGLRVAPRTVTLSDLEADPKGAVAGTRTVVTTDCHLGEVADAVHPLGIPVYVVSLDPAFPQVISSLVRRSPLLMVVRDARFAPVFVRLLRQLGADDGAIRRLTFAEPARLGAELRALPPDGHLFVSPTVRELVEARIPAGYRRVPGAWHVRDGALDRLRASLALDVALRETAGTH